MPPVKTAVPPQAAAIYDAYRGWLAARGVGDNSSTAAPATSWPGSPARRPGRTCRWPPGWRAPARSCSRC